MAGLVLRLLGSPTVSFADGRPVATAPGAKAVALLAYLTLEPKAHSREELAGLLWGESLETEARASLRQTLRAIRTSLGEVIRADRSVVELTETAHSDVTEFRVMLAQEPARALLVEPPRFLPGFFVRHAPQYEEWVEGIRIALLRDYHSALGTLAREAMAQRRWREASEAADRWLNSDSLSEDAARLAVEALYLSGNRGGALARFAGYRDALYRETGCEPGRGFGALMQRVTADRPGVEAAHVADEWDPPASSFEATLIGRESEWGRLTAAWSQVRHGEGRILLIDGEAGVGKSRLADEFLRWIVAEGVGTVLRGRNFDGRSGVPFEPVAEALRAALDAPGLAGASAEWLVEVARLIPELRQRFPSLAEPERPADSTEGWRLFEGIAQVLLALAGERPVAVAIDDLQWCDEDTCNLLRYLIRRLERSPVLWIGAITLGEVERDAPAARLCRVLRAKSHAEAIELAPLTEDQLWRMIRELGHVSTPTGARRLAARIHRITGGNPFYAIEVLKAMLAEGTLSADRTSGEWTVSVASASATREFPVSQTVQDLIAERVDRLPAELRELLITVAAGTGGRPEVLSHVHGISRLRAAAMADSLVERRLVVEEGGVYRCAHPVIAHVVRGGISTPRRRELHRMIAIATELATPAADRSSAAGEIALHADRGGEPALAYRYALMASDAAVHRYAFEEALSWLDLAAGSARGGPEADVVNRRTADLLEAAGWSAAPERRPVPLTREIVTEDLDLPVRG